MKALHDVVVSGKVWCIGASSMWAYQLVTMQFCAEKNGWTKFVSMQSQYILLYQDEEREMNKSCDETGVGLLPWSPLCRGFLARLTSENTSTTRSAHEASKTMSPNGLIENDQIIIKCVQEIAEKHGWKMSHVPLAWINRRIASPIIGFSSIERMEEAIAVKVKKLTDKEEEYLEELYVPKEMDGHPITYD